MSGEEFVLTIIAIAAGVAVIGIIFGTISGLVKTWIKAKKEHSQQLNPEFFKALSEFKRQTESRLNALEKGVSQGGKKGVQAADTKPEIRMENPTQRIENQEKNGGNLKNMLKE